ncbi:MAG: 16S rRNA (uracil(1498)-N(3))-methyltransferase [Acidobacteria bacterium]|nr:MAG: 16S rRNA (uracil(1498)-N(3))-methyltransferase [Acidobacteriota bacterium]PYV32337.1 MAG: 16S rRNA (uracil(1498)-N(3))-methyltransferase [Acidobacteriota bacterium]
MPRRRFFVPPENIKHGIARLPPDQIHHLRDVLRLRPGDPVEIFDGKGVGYRGKVAREGSDVVVVDLQEIEPRPQAPLRLMLALALTRSDTFEWIIQKAAELGAAEIIPLVTRFSEVRITESKLEARMARWQRILREACKQCARSSVPELRAPLAFEEFLKSELYQDACRCLFYEKASVPWSGNPALSSRFLVCIGPEGGWDAGEVETAIRAGFRTFSLGPRILRAETAAVAVLAIFQYLLGDLGPRSTDD